MRVRPDYFLWSPERQERYGTAMLPCEEVALDAALFQELFRRPLKAMESVETALYALTAAERRRWYEAILPLKGFGHDSFHFTQRRDPGESLVFTTLRAFDESAYEREMRLAHRAFARDQYRGELYGTEACLLVDGRFTYAALSMASAYIYSRLSDICCDVLKEFIPYCYVPGRNHGRADGEHRIWDLRVKADGQEQLVEELQARIGGYVLERFDFLREYWDAADWSSVYAVNESRDPGQPWIHFVFSDTRALSRVRLRSFAADCRTLDRPVTELKEHIDCEEALLRDFIRKQSAVLSKHCDPRVVRFRHARRVRLTQRSLRWIWCE